MLFPSGPFEMTKEGLGIIMPPCNKMVNMSSINVVLNWEEKGNWKGAFPSALIEKL